MVLKLIAPQRGFHVRSDYMAKATKKQKRIYADAAAANPIHPRVQKRIISLLSTFANPGALHKEALMAKAELEKARKEVATAIGAHADEIFFTGSGTEANNLGIQGVLLPLLRAHTKVHAITLNVEHPSVLEVFQYLRRYGLQLTVLEVDENGLISGKDLRAAIRPETALISIQLVNSEVGTVEPLRDLAKEIRHVRKERAASSNDMPLYFHTDACQGPLYTPIKVDSLGIDLATLDGQKIQGPKSVGALYRRRGTASEALMYGGRQERGLRPGTENCVLAGAMAESMTMAQTGVEKRAKQTAAVRDYLWAQLQKKIPSIRVNGSMKERVANNLNISIPGLEGETAVIALDAQGIAVSTRAACVTRDEAPSHVIMALTHDKQRSREAVRITLLPDATKKDADRIVAAFEKACALYRQK